jgi:hypothetical protein
MPSRKHFAWNVENNRQGRSSVIALSLFPGISLRAATEGRPYKNLSLSIIILFQMALFLGSRVNAKRNLSRKRRVEMSLVRRGINRPQMRPVRFPHLCRIPAPGSVFPRG